MLWQGVCPSVCLSLTLVYPDHVSLSFAFLENNFKNIYFSPVSSLPGGKATPICSNGITTKFQAECELGVWKNWITTRKIGNISET